MVFLFSRIHSDIINTQLLDLRFPGVICSCWGGMGARDGKKERPREEREGRDRGGGREERKDKSGRETEQGVQY